MIKLFFKQSCILIFFIRTVKPQTWIMNGIFQAENGTLESSHPYGNSQHSLWKVIAPVGAKIWFRARFLREELKSKKNIGILRVHNPGGNNRE